MSTVVNDDDRFGMPDSAFEAAGRSHGFNKPAFRVGMYVPTRAEVATLAPNELRQILIGWFYECPTELIPNITQIREVIAILTSRADATEFASFIEGSEQDLLS